MDQESFERSILASRPEEVRELLHLGSSRPCSRRDYVRMLMQRGTSLLTLNRKSKDMAALVKYARELTDNKNGRDEIKKGKIDIKEQQLLEYSPINISID